MTGKRVARDKASLRSIQTALIAYAIDWHTSPNQLEVLTRPYPNARPMPVGAQRKKPTGYYLTALPQSAFTSEPPRYYCLHPALGGFYSLLWTPGPDRVFDISADDPELKTAMSSMLADGKLAPWLIRRVYDPSNGTHSGGDIIRLEGAWTGGAELR